LQHIKRNHQQQETAGEFEGWQRDSENPKEILADCGEYAEYHKTSQSGAASHLLAPCMLVTSGHGEEGGGRGEGIDDEEHCADGCNPLGEQGVQNSSILTHAGANAVGAKPC
jgi:hypothetical protein